MQIYKKLKGWIGFPLIELIKWTQEYNIIIMSLLGENLDTISRKHTLSLETILTIGLIMIDWIKELHDIDYIHWDIKPDNFLLGWGSNSDKIYMIDFGLSKKF